MALSGPTADAVARALLAALLVRAGPGAAEVLLTEDLAGRLLPGLASDGDIRSGGEQRRRGPGSRGRTHRPHPSPGRGRGLRRRPVPGREPREPPPGPARPSRRPARRVARTVVGAPRRRRRASGSQCSSSADSPAATGRLVLDAERTVTSAQPAALAERLDGVELFGLDADETVELLGSVNEANQDGDDDDDPWDIPARPITTLHPADSTGNAEHATPGEEPWPEPLRRTHLRTRLRTDPTGPSWSRCSARMRITAFGQPVSTGLASPGPDPARLVRCCAPRAPPSTRSSTPCGPTPRPTGCSSSSGIPSATCAPTSAAPAGGPRSLGEGRRALPAQPGRDRLRPVGLPVRARRRGPRRRRRPGPRRAAPSGRRLPGRPAGRESATPWVEPVRQDLHRRAVDAHLRLAELEDHAGHPDAAVAVLERIIDMDRYAEEPYRRLMALHAAHGRLDAVTATWQLLQRRLADLDVDVDEATARLYRTLIAPDPDPPTGTRPDPPHVVSVAKALPGLDTPARIAATCVLGAGHRGGDGLAVRVVRRASRLPRLRGGRRHGQRVPTWPPGASPTASSLPPTSPVPALLAVASAASGSWWPLARAAIGAALLVGFYLALGLAFPAGMGLGDVKWAGVIGLYLGYLGWTDLPRARSSPSAPPRCSCSLVAPPGTASAGPPDGAVHDRRRARRGPRHPVAEPRSVGGTGTRS